MNRNNFWRFVIVVLVVAWSIYEIYPPTGRELTVVFQERAVKRDAAYTNIVERLQPLQQKTPERAFGNLLDAVGTNDITRYFPFFEIKQEANPTRAVLNRLQREAAGRIKLGLDLQGGSSFLVGVDLAKATSEANAAGTETNQVSTNALPQDVTEKNERILSQAVEVLRRRVDKFGVAEPLIQPAGDDRILIQLPGLSEAERENAKKQIEKAAYLEFRLVHPESDSLVIQGITEPGYEFLRYPHQVSSGQDVPGYLVKKKPELTGKYIRHAMVSRNPINNSLEIDFTLNAQGAEIFARVTEENVNRQLAIILDGELRSAPNINGPIPGGRGQITGGFTAVEAQELANVLENPLEAPVKIEQESSVDPSLGKDSIQSGMVAAIIAGAATFCFMFLFYFFVGFIANFALALNVVILLGLMCSIGTTLTLPGIAGIALAIGMAVDANVLIYERLREELAAGKSLRGAIAAAYSKAFGTIFDSNLTTLISAVILIWMGTGPIKGFGVTLAIGLCVHMFTALVVTRLIFDYLLDKNLIKTIRILPVMKGTKLDFLRWAKPVFVLSWVLILAGIGYGLYRGRDMMGVDFIGGDSMTIKFEQKVEVDKLRAAIEKLGVGDASIQYQKDLGSGTEALRVTTRDVAEEPVAGATSAAQKVENVLKDEFKEAKFEVIGREKVGATVGKEIQRSAIIASLLALFAILLYVAFRYELSFAVAAVVAGVHDVLLTLGIYVLLGREFNSVLVAAVLTIIGYSINDKIVILDRIREDLKLGVRGSFKELINIALNQTLSRTMITGGSVILATIALLVFGGGAIKDFAIAFLTGTLVGTFSSMFIASPLVLWWHKGERPKMSASPVVMDQDMTMTARR